ncbi:polysaccharide biosynthesis protein [Candidatus Thioglobus sp. NP1]|uniref:polysaccharide biosynthesis protein n=1 Tax=Candidatus Thioglobus sp. NP1 TaxID=2508687 RepID=UPI00352B602F
MLDTIINLSRRNKKLVMLFVDSVLLLAVIMLSFSIRVGHFYLPEGVLFYWVVFSAPIVAIPIFVRFGLYRAVIRYIGFKELWAIVQAVSLYALVLGVIGYRVADWYMTDVDNVVSSVILINWLLAIIAIGGSRMIGRWLLSETGSRKRTNVVIYGAGSAGRQLSNALTQSNDYKMAAFIDNNAALLGQSIHGINVVSRHDLGRLIEKKNVTEVLLAIPSLTRAERNEIIHFLEPYSVLVRSLPSVSELAQGKLRIADLRDVTIKDLLGRDSVAPNSDLLGLNIANKVVMVTGAGGSIGSELCRQILALKPQVLVLFDQSEFALYGIHKELINVGMTNVQILQLLGSVTNYKRLSHILQRFDVNTIYHAAAYKHVPMVESNNAEGVSNNIFGTLTCAQAAIDHGVDTFVLISTDKAVRPTNTMGATKRVAELVLQTLAVGCNTRFSMVRFGNVLNSSGSVIPLFKEQIKEGGPITVTDPEIQRYFMTIPEAVELVIQAGAMAEGGDVFVLDMGEPVRILDLAQKMIRLSGLQVKDKLNPNGDIEIKFTGLRPGEKLYEELLIGGNVSKTNNPMILRAEEEMLAWGDLKLILDELEQAVDSGDQVKLRQLLIKAVPGFKPQSLITDILYEA